MWGKYALQGWEGEACFGGLVGSVRLAINASIR